MVTVPLFGEARSSTASSVCVGSQKLSQNGIDTSDGVVYQNYTEVAYMDRAKCVFIIKINSLRPSLELSLKIQNTFTALLPIRNPVSLSPKANMSAPHSIFEVEEPNVPGDGNNRKASNDSHLEMCTEMCEFRRYEE